MLQAKFALRFYDNGAGLAFTSEAREVEEV